MARNEQIARQVYLLQRLVDTRRGVTLTELAAGLPDGSPRHPRTIRRGIEALEVSGYPVVTDRVDGQTRWRLLEGFRQVPAIAFSPTEAMALVFIPLGFDIDAYVRDALVVMRGRPVTVELALDKATTAWARDRVWHPGQQWTALRGGRYRLTLQEHWTGRLGLRALYREAEGD